MFGRLGAPEIILILVVIILLFGAKKLPDMARSLGKSARILKSEAKAMKAEGSSRRPGRSAQHRRAAPGSAHHPGRARRRDQLAPGHRADGHDQALTPGPDAVAVLPHEMRTWVAQVCPQQKEKDPEGRMPLADHLRELRNRLAKAMLAIVVVTVVAAFYYKNIIDFFTEADAGLGRLHRRASPSWRSSEAASPARRSCSTVCSPPFTLALKVSLMAGVVARLAGLALPALGLRRARACTRTRRSTRCASSASGVPLFVAGALLRLQDAADHARRCCSSFTPATLRQPAPAGRPARPRHAHGARLRPLLRAAAAAGHAQPHRDPHRQAHARLVARP